MPEFTYEIVKTFGVISEGAGGWAKELNLISWNGKEPKYDIRDWGPDHEKMGKGVTLTAADAKALKELLVFLSVVLTHRFQFGRDFLFFYRFPFKQT